MFKHCGYFLFAPGLSEDEVMEVALEAGADDVITDEEDAIEVICSPQAFEEVNAAFEAKGWKPEVAEVTWKKRHRNCSLRRTGRKNAETFGCSRRSR